MSNWIQLHKHASYSYCARSWPQQTNPSRKKNFSSIFYFGILLLKNWLRLRQQFKLNMESFESADEEELSTFSLGMEFLTPQKEWKEKENKEQAQLVSSCFANHRVKMLWNNWFIHQLCVHRDMKHLGSLESTQEARIALGYASSNSYTSFVLSKLSACFISQWTHADVWTSC